MGKAGRAKGRWVTRVRTEHEKPKPARLGPAEVWVLDCFDCGKEWHFDTQHQAHVQAKEHLCNQSKHETFLSLHRFDEFGNVEVEDVDLWEDVATWGPSVGLEVVTKEKG